MWKLVKVLWKLIGLLRHLIGPALLILAAIIGYLLMKELVLGGLVKF